MRKNFLGDYINVNVQGKLYPVSTEMNILCYIVYGIQFFLFYVIFFNDHARTNLNGFLPATFFEYFQRKKWGAAVMTFILGNLISSWITKTGAFEIYLDNKLISSKLQQGVVPQYSELVKYIKNLGINLE